MNDTNITPRQSAIIDIIDDSPKLGSDILQQLAFRFPISKATLMRDINKLEDLKLISTSGKGKATKYLSLIKRVDKPIDLDEYFKDGSLLRKIGPKYFNFQVFGQLEQLFSAEEIKDLAQKYISLREKQRVLDPSIFKREIERFTVEFAWKSSKIEGNTYSLLETEILIKQMKEAYGRSKYEAAMILNHKYALDYILNNPNNFKVLSVSKIYHLHEILTKDLEITSGIRNNRVAITGTDFTPLEKGIHIQEALGQTVKLVNLTDFPLAKALITLALIAYIQPFVDGNKRTSRTLANAILIAHDYFPLSYRNLDEVEYLKALLLFYETNNYYHLKRILLEQYHFALDNYFQQ